MMLRTSNCELPRRRTESEDTVSPCAAVAGLLAGPAPDRTSPAPSVAVVPGQTTDPSPSLLAL